MRQVVQVFVGIEKTDAAAPLYSSRAERIRL